MSTIYTYPDGSKVEVYPDGTITKIDPNGDSTTYDKGTITIKKKGKKPRTIKGDEKPPPGSGRWSFQDGKRIIKVIFKKNKVTIIVTDNELPPGKISDDDVDLGNGEKKQDYPALPPGVDKTTKPTGSETVPEDAPAGGTPTPPSGGGGGSSKPENKPEKKPKKKPRGKRRR